MLQRLIGITMRLYRRSPLYPSMGKFLGRMLWVATGRGGKVVEKELRGGLWFRLRLDEVIDASLYYSGTFEAEAEVLIEGSLRPGMIAIDVGANVGYHSLRMAKSVGPSGKVVAIEPTTSAMEHLKINAKLNDLPALIFSQVALDDTDRGMQTLGFRSSYRLDGKTVQNPESVRVTTLDLLVAELGLERVDFIKCDVDGFEARVFRGSLETLRRFKPRLFFEVTPSEIRKHGDDLRVFFSNLSEIGYRFVSDSGVAIPEIHEFISKVAPGASINLLATVDV